MLTKAEPGDCIDRDAVLAEAADLLEDGRARCVQGISRIIGKDDRETVCWLTMGRQRRVAVAVERAAVAWRRR